MSVHIYWAQCHCTRTSHVLLQVRKYLSSQMPDGDKYETIEDLHLEMHINYFVPV